jgi:hypothetical protein
MEDAPARQTIPPELRLGSGSGTRPPDSRPNFQSRNPASFMTAAAATASTTAVGTAATATVSTTAAT